MWKSLSRNVVEPPVAWGMLKLIWQSPGEYVLEGNLGLAGKWTGCLKTFFMLPWREDKMFILVSGFNRFGDISSYWRLQNYSAQRLLHRFLFFSRLRAIWAVTKVQLSTQNLSRVAAGVKKHFSTWRMRFWRAKFCPSVTALLNFLEPSVELTWEKFGLWEIKFLKWILIPQMNINSCFLQ